MERVGGLEVDRSISNRRASTRQVGSVATVSKFPYSVQFLDLASYSVDVMNIERSNALTFHTQHVSTFTPTSMMFLAETCRHRSRIFSEEKISYIGLRRHSYANNLGFSEALNLKGNPFPQGAFGGKNYFPLSRLERGDLENLVSKSGIEIGDAIQEKCNEIAHVVSQRKSPALEKVLADSFREIFRNVFEHACVDRAAFCAQYWPSRDLVEICISDRGVGFSKSLSNDSDFSGLSDREALMFSIMPGVSGKARKHKKKKSHQKSVWDNSGFGLYFASQLAGKFGWFGVASGKHAIFVENGGKLRHTPANIEGSIVSIRLKLNSVEVLEQEIYQIGKKAAKVKQTIGVRNLTPRSVESFLAHEWVSDRD